VSTAVKLQPDQPRYAADERLISECLRGNQEAWAALIDKYKNLIYSIPIKLEMREEAPDIFQSVCLDLVAGLGQLREPRALPKWLMQACYHKCLQFRRRKERISLDDESDRELPFVSEQSPPERLLEELETEQIVRDSVAELSPRCERLIRMLFYEMPPRPYRDVAEILNIATGSIGFTRARCLQKLRKVLEKSGF
jgi:RNA polymerase sigma factor (sigma-70 family)